jgi:hypothetical protein
MKMIGSKFWRGKIIRSLQQLLVIGATITALGGCGPGLDSLGVYAIGGTITGLTGTVILQNNAGDDLSLNANGSFTFSKTLAKNASYVVTVRSQPTGQNCTVSSGSGTATADVSSVSVQCIVFSTAQVGASGANTYGVSVATDASGNFYVTGDTSGVLDTSLSTAMGNTDSFVTKYNSSGIKQFTKQMGVAGLDTKGLSVATYQSLSFYVVGETTGGLDSNTPTGIKDLFVTKYTSDGAKTYTKQLGALNGSASGHAVTTDVNENVYVVGETTGALNGGLQRGNTDSFVAMFDSIGTLKSTTQLGSVGADTFGRAVATDNNGNVYVVGDTGGALSSGVAGVSDLFLAKYSTGNNGSLSSVYIKQLGATGAYTYGRSVSIDTSGNVYVVGETSGSLPLANTRTGTTDFFIAKYNSAGVQLYIKQLGGLLGTNTVARSVVVDNSGNIFVAGETTAALDGNTRMGATDFFVTKYDGNLVKQYTRQFGAVGANTYGRSVAANASGNVYVAGYTTGGLDGNVLTGTTDFFVTKYDSALVKQLFQ